MMGKEYEQCQPGVVFQYEGDMKVQNNSQIGKAISHVESSH